MKHKQEVICKMQWEKQKNLNLEIDRAVEYLLLFCFITLICEGRDESEQARGQ